MGYPICNIFILREGYSTVIKAESSGHKEFEYYFTGIEEALNLGDVDIRLFGKSQAWNDRRLGVILAKNKFTGQKARNFISIHKKK